MNRETPSVDQTTLAALGAGPETSLVLLFDGDCPLCAREVAWLRRFDDQQRVLFVDIAAASFDAAPLGLTQRDVMGEIHAIQSDGSIVHGMEVFRLVYSAVGFGWLVAPTRWPGLRALSEAAYRFFARHRLWLTGRGRGDEELSCP